MQNPIKKPKGDKEEDVDDLEWEREYKSDDIYSNDPDESDSKKGPKTNVFKMSQLKKTFKFKVGMKFKLIAEFKEAIREWNEFNGFQIKFVKNDKEMCRVV